MRCRGGLAVPAPSERAFESHLTVPVFPGWHRKRVHGSGGVWFDGTSRTAPVRTTATTHPGESSMSPHQSFGSGPHATGPRNAPVGSGEGPYGTAVYNAGTPRPSAPAPDAQPTRVMPPRQQSAPAPQAAHAHATPQATHPGSVP